MNNKTPAVQPEIAAQIEEYTGNAGFCEFKIIPADTVIYDKNVYTLLEMECTQYEPRSYSVPPMTGTYEECCERLSHYSNALLLSTIYPTHDNMDLQSWVAAGQELNRMISELAPEIARLLPDQNVLPLGIRCRRCEECAAPDAPCRHPETMLPATESYGIHIMNTMETHEITGYYDGQTIVCFGIIFF